MKNWSYVLVVTYSTTSENVINELLTVRANKYSMNVTGLINAVYIFFVLYILLHLFGILIFYFLILLIISDYFPDQNVINHITKLRCCLSIDLNEPFTYFHIEQKIN